LWHRVDATTPNCLKPTLSPDALLVWREPNDFICGGHVPYSCRECCLGAGGPLHDPTSPRRRILIAASREVPRQRQDHPRSAECVPAQAFPSRSSGGPGGPLALVRAGRGVLLRDCADAARARRCAACAGAPDSACKVAQAPTSSSGRCLAALCGRAQARPSMGRLRPDDFSDETTRRLPATYRLAGLALPRSP